jgi:hypothetical protein
MLKGRRRQNASPSWWCEARSEWLERVKISPSAWRAGMSELPESRHMVAAAQKMSEARQTLIFVGVSDEVLVFCRDGYFSNRGRLGGDHARLQR